MLRNVPAANLVRSLPLPAITRILPGITTEWMAWKPLGNGFPYAQEPPTFAGGVGRCRHAVPEESRGPTRAAADGRLAHVVVGVGQLRVLAGVGVRVEPGLLFLVESLLQLVLVGVVAAVGDRHLRTLTGSPDQQQ